jgi:hypothetical protein
MVMKLNPDQNPMFIEEATPVAAGLMSASDKKKLDGLAPGALASTAFRRTVVQPADGSDFIVAIPATPFFNGNYVVVPALVTSGDGSVPIRCPIDGVARTANAFRVVTDVSLSNGAVIEFSLLAFA